MRADEFYVDTRRRDSDEIEFGRAWVDEWGYGPYQLNWIVDTGEVVAFFFGDGAASHGADVGLTDGDIPGAIVGALIGGATGGPEQVILFGEITDRDRMDAVLDGWGEHEGIREGFTWLRERLASPP